MPSFPSPGNGNDPLDPFALLICEWCGKEAFRLRRVGDQFICDTCYSEADTQTMPSLPALAPIQAGTVVDELRDCEPSPIPGRTFCAAAYLTYLEASGMSIVPLGEPELCDAHWRACIEDAIRQFPMLGYQPWKAPMLARILASTYIRVAESTVARIAARLESR